MNGKPISKSEIEKMRSLRQTGHSLPEIQRIVKRGYGSVYQYIKGVQILPGYTSIREIKREGNKRKALERWERAEQKTRAYLANPISLREHLIIAACLYWGEGSKKEFGIINSDPAMIKTILRCLEALSISKTRIKVSIRIYEDIDPEQAVAFWAKIVQVPHDQIKSINIIRGKKSGKLKYGMCRLRVAKGQDIFKLLQCAIKEITLKIESL